MTKQNILVIGAHSDDQVIGAGAAMAKYAQQGHRVKTVIFSYGEKTHPHLKANIIANIRRKESQQADKIIGGKGVVFLGLTEWQFEKEYSTIEKQLTLLIRRFKPHKIFTHSIDDGHPDHVAVHKLVANLYDKMRLLCDVYTFDVWTPFNLKKRNNPWLFVDVSDTFRKKLDALKCFQSQKWHAILILISPVYIRAIYNGLLNNTQFGEVFYKIR